MKHRTETYDSTYIFSAEQQEEVKKIQQKYSSPDQNKKDLSAEEEKMERLRKLDKSVTNCGTIAALIDGAIGAIVHGIGIALVQRKDIFMLGSVIAVGGLTLFLLAYPVYSYVAKRQRQRVEPEILKLCKELLK